MKPLSLVVSRQMFPLAAALAAMLNFFGASSASAANYYWDTNSTTAGLGDIAGTWGTNTFVATVPNNNVLLGTASTANTATTNADALYFGTNNLALGSTASTVGIVGTNVTINTIVLGAGQGSQGLTLSGGGGSISLAGGTPTITANNTGANAIGAVLAGTVGMTKAGAGSLVLTGANTYTGGLTIAGGGTLQVGNGTSGSLTSQALTFNNGGGVFNAQSASTGSTQAMAALTFSATGVGASTVQSTYGTSGNAALTFSSLAARGAGTTGNFVVSGGSNGTTNKITITGATTGALLDKGLFFGGGSYAAYDATGFVRAYGSGDAGFVSVAAGTDMGTPATTDNITLTGSLSAQGATAVNTINMGANGIAMDSSGTSLDLQTNGLLSSGSASATLGGGTTPRLQSTTSGGEMVVRVNGASDALDISSIIQNNTTASPLTKSGAGTLTLSGVNTHTGATTISAGTLAVSGGSAIADTGAVALANAAGAVFQLNNSETIGNLSGGGFSGGNVNVGANTLTISDNTNTTFGGKFTGAGAVTKTGTSTLTLSNVNSFAGALNINAGSVTLAYGNDGTANPAPLSSGGAISMAGGTFLNFSPTANVAGGVASNLMNNGTAGWTVSNAINVSSGTATIQTTGATGLNDIKWNFSGGVTGGTSGTQTLAINQGGFGSPSHGDRQDLLFSGIIANGSSGTLGLSVDFKSTSGTAQGAYVNLSGQNTFTGPITVSNTKGLIPNYTAGVAVTGGFLVIGGDRFNNNNNSPVSTTLTVGSGSLGTTSPGTGSYSNTISLATGTFLDYASTANQTLGGVISGGGNLIMEGAGLGTLTLGAANTFTGNTTVRGGILSLANSLALQNSAIDTTNSAAGTSAIGLKTALSSLTFGGLSGNKNLASIFTTTSGGYGGVSALTLNPAAGANLGYSGIIADGASGMSLTKNGLGAQTLSAANTYSGATTINAGTLALGNGGSLANTTSVAVNPTGVLGVKQTASSTINSIAAPITLASGSALNMGDGFTSQLNVTSASASSLAPASGVAPVLTFDIVGAAADQLNITGDATAGAAGAKINIPSSTNAITPGTYTVIAGGASSALNTGFSLTNSTLPNSGGLYTLSLASSTATAAIVTVTADANALYWKGVTTDLNAASNWTTDQAGTTASGSITSVNNLAFNATGAGNLTTSSLTAGLTVNSVTFLSGAASVTIASSANQLTINGGGITNASANAMTINNPITLGAAQSWTNNGAGLLTIGGAVANGSNLLTVAGTGNTTVSNIIGNGSGGLTKDDAGTLTLSGANTFTGAVTINAGTLAISSVNTVANANPLGQSAATAGNLILNGGTLRYTGVAATTDRLFSLQSSSTIDASGASNAALTLNNTGSMGFNGNTAAKTLTLTGTSTGQNTLAALIANNTGATSVTKTGTGTWVLSNAANSYTGGTTLSAGTLQYASKTAFGTGTLTLAGGTKLQKITEEANFVGNAMTNSITLSGGQVELNVSFSGVKDQWFSGTISGPGSLRITGDIRTVALSGNNDFTGGVTLDTNSNPWILLGHANALGTGTLAINATGGNLPQGLGATTALTSGSGVANNIVINSGATFNLGGFNASGNVRLSGIISGAGNLNKQDVAATTFTLAGANTYTGTTRVATGTLALGANDVLPDTSNVTIGAATLNASTFTDTAGTLAVAGAAIINVGSGGALAFANSSAVSWTGALNITGTFVPGSSIRFGTTSGGLTSGQLATISVNGSGAGTYTLNSSGYLVAGGSPFATWSGGATFGADANADGVSNGLAWVLGAPDKDTSALGLLPTIDNSDGTYFIFNFRRKDDANTDVTHTSISAQYSINLTGWTTAVHDGSNIIITPSNDFYATGVDKVEVKINRTLAPGGKLFARLNVTYTP